MTTTTLEYPKAVFEVDELNPITFKKFWTGLPAAPLHRGIARALLETVDAERPDLEAVRVVHLSDGKWHIDHEFAVTVWMVNNDSMEIILRIRKARKDKPVAEDYYQLTYSGFLERMHTLLVKTAAADADTRWLVTSLNNAPIAQWCLDNDIAGLQRQLCEQMGPEACHDFSCPFAARLNYLAKKATLDRAA